MTPIRIRKPTPDGLDPVFAAYEQLKRIYEAATPGSDTCTCKEDCPCEFYILLPGTDEPVNTNDVNELNQLERWLAEEVSSHAAGTK